MITEISAVKFRQNLGEMLNQVEYRHDSVVINKDGKPVAALIDTALFGRIRRMQARFDALFRASGGRLCRPAGRTGDGGDRSGYPRGAEYRIRGPRDGQPIERRARHQIDYLITGDKDLLVLADRYPIISPAGFRQKHG